jgi:peptidoglycan/xylan/chitin deacetylase (PgdA/CDA1 family)
MRRYLRQLVRPLRQYAAPKALVLMYHRVAEPEADIWDLAVTPAHFEQQLRVLQRRANVVPATALAEGLRTGTLPRRSVAITFDDGYLDNYTQARPLLERYQLPATFFITASPDGQKQEFWWDELVGILLLSEKLPPELLLTSEGVGLTASLAGEQYLTAALRHQHQHWKASHEAPPTARAALFYRLWEHLKPLPHLQQQALLHQLRAWAGWPAAVRPAYQCMAPSQVRELGSNRLFTIGAHTATHPALASHSAAVQAHELQAGSQALHQQLGYSPTILAYPYGNYNATTIELAAQLGFSAAFTTEASAVTTQSEPYRLGRFQIPSWTGTEFERHLALWFKD